MVTVEVISSRAIVLYKILLGLRNSPDKTMTYADFREKLDEEPNGSCIWGALVSENIIKPLGKRGKRTSVRLTVEDLSVEICRAIIEKIVNKHRESKGRPHVGEASAEGEKVEFFSKEDLIDGIAKLKARYDKSNPGSPVVITLKAEMSLTIN